MSNTERFHEIAKQQLGASTITDGMASAPAVDAYEEAAVSVSALLALAEETEKQLDYWDQQQREGMVPMSGAANKRREATETAKALASTAQRQFQQSIAAAEDALLDSALPKLASDSREALARQELEIALGNATGPNAKARVLGIAKSGSPEAQAVLATPFARTVLIARNVEGVDGILRDARKVIAHSESTPEAVKAAEGLGRLKALSAAATAAGRAFHYASRQ